MSEPTITCLYSFGFASEPVETIEGRRTVKLANGAYAPAISAVTESDKLSLHPIFCVDLVGFEQIEAFRELMHKKINALINQAIEKAGEA